MRAVTPAQMRQIDQETIERVGIPGIVLMERAALGLVEVLLEVFKPSPSARIGLACGAGNNGGDGLAMARLLHQRGFEVVIALAAEESKLKGDALINLRIVKNMGLPLYAITSQEPALAMSALPPCQLWCDALLGTGLDRPVEGVIAQLIEFLNAQPQVLAVDIPSGLNGLTGEVMGLCVQARATATLGLPKLGQLYSPGFAQGGQLHVVDIGLPEQVLDSVGAAAWLSDEAWCRARLKRRSPLMHKGDAGRVLVIAGSDEMAGAALMAAGAALEAGAGLVSVLTPREVIARVALAHPELMGIPSEDEARADEAISRADVVIIGPGLRTGSETEALVERALERARAIILDAEALNVLAQDPLWPQQLKKVRRGRPCVLTPHPGELARLTQFLPGQEHEAHRSPDERWRALAQASGAILVAKDARTVTVSPGGEVTISPFGNPGMASGGMGDTLTGVIAAQLIEQPDPHTACAMAVAIHGCAGDLAAAHVGERGVTASRVRERLGEVFMRWSARA